MVSVIIPNYNHHNFLVQRIDSVLSQTYQDIEVIILDDCSTDNSWEIIEKYRSNFKVSEIVYNKENSGSVFRQWKRGIDLAKGEYIWIAESDDFAEPELLSKMIPVLEKDKEIGLIYCNSKVIYAESINNKRYESLNDLRTNMFNSTLWNHSFSMVGTEFLSKYLSKKCVINNASAAIFRKNALNHSKTNLEYFKYAGDWAVYVDIALTNKIAFFNEMLSNYRDHESNASKKAFNNYQINYENYSIISSYYNYLVGKDNSGFKYIFMIRRSFLHLLITSKNRNEIYRNYKKINKKLIQKSLLFLPQVFVETYLSVFVNKFIRN